MNGTRLFATILGLLFIGGIGLQAQDQAETGETSGEGRIEVVGQFDWGTVGPQKLTAEIPIKNVGDGPLQIESVRPSCGCTAAPLDDYLLDPGQTTLMRITFDVSRRNGMTRKSVVIYSDDPEKATTIVQLQANVQRPIAFEPDVQYLIFQDAKVGEETNASIRITNQGEEDLTLFPPSLAEESGISVNLVEETVLAPNETFEFVATVTPTSTEQIMSEMTLRTSVEAMPERVFKLYGRVEEVSDAGTSQATIPAISAQE